jgi:ISXO2-like transposase domain
MPSSALRPKTLIAADHQTGRTAALLSRRGHYQLRGLLEVDEGYVGGVERGKKKQTARGVHKSVVAVAVERRGSGEKGRKPRPGFTALAVVEDASAPSLHGFLQSKAAVGSGTLTDAWRSYRSIEAKGFAHHSLRRGSDPAAAFHLFPWVHVTLSNLKRFLLGTHHKVEAQHLKRYAAEFVYRLNRRAWEEDLFHHLTQACLATYTLIYRDLIASPDLT